MAIFKENIDVVNPEGDFLNDSRKSEITFYGFLNQDQSLDDAFTGIGITVYTDADNSNPLNDGVFSGQFNGISGATPTFTVEIDSVGGSADTFKWSKDGFATTLASTVPITTNLQSLSDGVLIKFDNLTGHSVGDQFEMTVLATTSQPHEMGKLRTVHEGAADDHKSSLSLTINNDGYPTEPIFSGTGLNDLSFGGRYNNNNKELVRLGYYVKIDSTGTPDTFSWSKDNFSTTEATSVSITGSAQTLEHGITVTFTATTGHNLNDVWTSFVYDDAIKIFSNNLVKFSSDKVQAGGVIVSFKVYDVNGNLLNGV